MIDYSSKVRGTAETKRQFNELSNRGKRAVLRAGGRKAGRVLGKEMKNRAPRRRGELRKGINLRVKAKEASVVVHVGPSRDVFYGMFSELGTKFQPATPWMRPAAQAVMSQIRDAFVAEVDAQIIKRHSKENPPAEIEEFV